MKQSEVIKKLELVIKGTGHEIAKVKLKDAIYLIKQISELDLLEVKK